MNKKLLLSFTLAAAMTGCINDSDVPSGNGDNPATGARGGNMEISFLVPNSSNGSRAASAEDSGVYEADNHNSRCGGGLDDRCHSSSKQHSFQRCVRQLIKNQLQLISRHFLQSVSHQGHTKKEQCHSAEQR